MTLRRWLMLAIIAIHRMRGHDMRNKGYVKLTKASRNDSGVTITVKRLSQILDKRASKKFAKACSEDRWPTTKVVLDIRGVPVLFHLSRGGTTLYSAHYPESLPQPEVGKPIESIFVSKFRLQTFVEA